MKTKKILLIGLALLILTVGAVSAAEDTNLTATGQQTEIDNEILTDNNDKENLNPILHFDYEVPKYAPLKDHYYLSIDGINEDALGSVKIYIDDDYKGDYKNSDQGYELEPYKYSLGKHVISAKFTGDEKYNPFNVNTTFNVVEVLIYIPNEVTSNDNTINIRIGENASGTAKIYVNGTHYETIAIEENYNNQYSNLVDLSSLEVGTYKINVVYSGDKKYPKTTKTKFVRVTYEILTEINPIFYQNNECGLFYLPENVKKMPIVKIGDKQLNVSKISKTDYEIDYGNIAPGVYELDIIYPGDDIYPPKMVRKTLEVISEIEVDNYFSIEKPGQVLLKLPEDAKGNLCIYIDNELYANVTPNTPVALDRLKVGAYYMNAEYSAKDYDIEPAFATIEVTPKLTFPKVMRCGADENCIIDFNEDINATLTYCTEDKILGKIEIINGKGKFSLKDIPISKEDETNVNFNCPSTQGNDLEVNIYIKVKPAVSKLVGGKDITMYYNGGNIYALTVWGDYGKIVGSNQIVKVKIAAKTYSVKTDKKGVAKLKILEAPGKYLITATYHGAKQSNKLVVKHVLALKSIIVKKSAKKLTLTATLKNKKAIKNKIITFKFKGKTYKAKTNSKGVAKATIPLKVLKKLKIGQKVTYQATYIKDTVKKTATVKR